MVGMETTKIPTRATGSRSDKGGPGCVWRQAGWISNGFHMG